jgi:hypothetical protein
VPDASATSGAHRPAGGTVAFIPAVIAFLERGLGRELEAHDTGIHAARAIAARVGAGAAGARSGGRA